MHEPRNRFFDVLDGNWDTGMSADTQRTVCCHTGRSAAPDRLQSVLLLTPGIKSSGKPKTAIVILKYIFSGFSKISKDSPACIVGGMNCPK